ncbi:hypothetical protein [Francisella sp. TX07-6608]|uniref:hypothetical protein n=1 Tax=Francisella sp. TX07-6608 TaxID=573568 RepID=UPI0008F9A9DF|nr:hypothetical protein [Francisella sp. TX07-6608]OIN84710.1 hypothetical protein KX00_250 [Francisella sp. TX07-6608]
MRLNKKSFILGALLVSGFSCALASDGITEYTLENATPSYNMSWDAAMQSTAAAKFEQEPRDISIFVHATTDKADLTNLQWQRCSIESIDGNEKTIIGNLDKSGHAMLMPKVPHNLNNYKVKINCNGIFDDKRIVAPLGSVLFNFIVDNSHKQISAPFSGLAD